MIYINPYQPPDTNNSTSLRLDFQKNNLNASFSWYFYSTGLINLFDVKSTLSYEKLSSKVPEPEYFRIRSGDITYSWVVPTNYNLINLPICRSIQSTGNHYPKVINIKLIEINDHGCNLLRHIFYKWSRNVLLQRALEYLCRNLFSLFYNQQIV